MANRREMTERRRMTLIAWMMNVNNVQLDIRHTDFHAGAIVPLWLDEKRRTPHCGHNDTDIRFPSVLGTTKYLLGTQASHLRRRKIRHSGLSGFSYGTTVQIWNRGIVKSALRQHTRHTYSVRDSSLSLSLSSFSALTVATFFVF